MNFELFIARRILFSSQGTSISKPIVRIAVAGVALGFAVMIIALAVVAGFKKEIRDKVIGFGSHVQISSFTGNTSYETQPMEKDSSFIITLKNTPGVTHLQEFAIKAGIIKSKTEIEGVVMKGVALGYDWSYLQKNLVEGTLPKLAVGKMPTPSNSSFEGSQGYVPSLEILISKKLADRLTLHANDSVLLYFIQQPPRVRKLRITGIYQTGLEDFDNKYIFGDIELIRKLNDWTSLQTGGYEITIDNFDKLDEIGDHIYQITPPEQNSRTIKEIYPQIFDWLGLQDVNGFIILTLMMVVSGMNMISALLIIILERVRMIGMLKSLGAFNVDIRTIFLYVATFLIGRGLLFGNIIGLGLCLLQKQFGLFHLDQSSYYISYVPIHITAFNWFALNIGTLVVCVAMMILPTLIITKISPLRALRFD